MKAARRIVMDAILKAAMARWFLDEQAVQCLVAAGRSDLVDRTSAAARRLDEVRDDLQAVRVELNAMVPESQWF
ncbi:hypothetical protein A6A25_22880 [Saccharothrix sp. CB00851]|nr:hypothetical protein A6A25_22880 [Saccharothrix sp. CB00851]